jgi:pyrroloquinoline quinone biosynthesis protein D
MTGVADPAADCVPRLPRGVRLHHDRVRGGWTILAPERVIETDMVGAEILKRCDGVATLAAIVDALAALFDADRAEIERDVRAFLADLAAKRMLEL